MQGKQICKYALQDACGFEKNIHVPIFGVIARLFEQKGLDIYAQIIPELVKNMRMQICILGSGDAQLEHQFTELMQEFPENVYAYIGYKESLAHLIEAGSDFFVMPSRFEPCGLNQMYSMKYGTLPIVRSTGGLKDTVINFDEFTGTGTGFVFHDFSEKALYDTISWACHTYYRSPAMIQRMQKQAMHTDCSWHTSAEKYIQVYHWAKEKKQ